MILAAADCADDDTKSPPPELVLGWQWTRFGTPPKAGGLEDQRAGEIDRITAALNTYDAMNAWKRAKAQGETVFKFPQQFPTQWRIVTEVIKMRKERDARDD